MCGIHWVEKEKDFTREMGVLGELNFYVLDFSPEFRRSKEICNGFESLLNHRKKSF